jgi:hypothetical protein
LPLALDVLLSVILFGYIACFLVIGASKGRAYFRSSPIDNKPENIEREVAAFERSETISQTLAGFSLAALTFIISLSSDLVNFETLITLFSLSLVFEVAASLFYRHADLRLYKYLGFVFQYAGLLAIIEGFFSFLVDALPNSYSIWLVYISALVLFFWLTTRELRFYLSTWKGWEIREMKRQEKKEEG